LFKKKATWGARVKSRTYRKKEKKKKRTLLRLSADGVEALEKRSYNINQATEKKKTRLPHSEPAKKKKQKNRKKKNEKGGYKKKTKMVAGGKMEKDKTVQRKQNPEKKVGGQKNSFQQNPNWKRRRPAINQDRQV